METHLIQKALEQSEEAMQLALGYLVMPADIEARMACRKVRETLPLVSRAIRALAKSVSDSNAAQTEELGEKDARPATTSSTQIARELLRVAICPECDGSGAKQVQTGSREYVTRDMAHDAGDLSMEGSLYRDDSFEVVQCQWCYERSVILSEQEGNSHAASVEASPDSPAPQQNELSVLLDQIEQRAKNVQTFGEARLWSAQQGLSYGRTMQESQADVPPLIKALRRAIETLTVFPSPNAINYRVEAAIADIAQLLREPAESKQEN